MSRDDAVLLDMLIAARRATEFAPVWRTVETDLPILISTLERLIPERPS